MQVCTSLQTDNHASTPPFSFLQAGCPFCHPTNNVKALKATSVTLSLAITLILLVRCQGQHPACKNDNMLVRLSAWSEVQTLCIWSIQEKRPLNRCSNPNHKPYYFCTNSTPFPDEINIQQFTPNFKDVCLPLTLLVGQQEGHLTSKKLSGGVLASVKSRLDLPFWYWLTRVVPDKAPLNGCVCVFKNVSNFLCLECQ